MIDPTERFKTQLELKDDGFADLVNQQGTRTTARRATGSVEVHLKGLASNGKF